MIRLKSLQYRRFSDVYGLLYFATGLSPAVAHVNVSFVTVRMSQGA